VKFKGKEILNLPVNELNQIRGVKMSMIFQDPMTSLNPYLSVKRQVTEVLEVHRGLSEDAALKTAIELLDIVQIPEARRRVHMYPHEFSGGMRQRVMIAMALLCQPELLIADEPTTALDVTVQAQILDLVAGLRRDFNMALTLITHDMGVIAGMCDRVMVMYGGRVIEAAPAGKLFHDPQHPYSAGLLRSMPRLDETMHERLTTIAGQPPNLQRLPSGCAFRDRCDYRMEICATELPPLRGIAPERSKACHLQAL
jgi:oligopeptide transport system ATP-binding protein